MRCLSSSSRVYACACRSSLAVTMMQSNMARHQVCSSFGSWFGLWRNFNSDNLKRCQCTVLVSFSQMYHHSNATASSSTAPANTGRAMAAAEKALGYNRMHLGAPHGVHCTCHVPSVHCEILAATVTVGT